MYFYVITNTRKSKGFKSGNKRDMHRLKFFYENMKHLFAAEDNDWGFLIFKIKDGKPKATRLGKCPEHVKAEYFRITGYKKVYRKPYQLKPAKSA